MALGIARRSREAEEAARRMSADVANSARQELQSQMEGLNNDIARLWADYDQAVSQRTGQIMGRLTFSPYEEGGRQQAFENASENVLNIEERLYKLRKRNLEAQKASREEIERLSRLRQSQTEDALSMSDFRNMMRAAVYERDRINAEFKKQEAELVEAHAEAREKMLAAEKEASKTRGQIMKRDLQSQFDELREWTENMSTLAERGFDERLIEKFREKGVQASGEIRAFVEMTDNELDGFVELWREKYELARNTAIEELVPLRRETLAEVGAIRVELAKLGRQELKLNLAYEEAILLEDIKYGLKNGLIELADISAESLELLTHEFKQKGEEALNLLGLTIAEDGTVQRYVEDLSRRASRTLGDSIRTADYPRKGRNIVEGLILGLDAKAPILIERARALAASVAEAMANVLEIFSPSRVMFRLGEYVADGFILGIDKMALAVDKMKDYAEEIKRVSHIELDFSTTTRTNARQFAGQQQQVPSYTRAGTVVEKIDMNFYDVKERDTAFEAYRKVKRLKALGYS